MVVLVTGSNGQLGQSLQHIAANYPQLQWVFCDSSTLDITQIESVQKAFQHYQPDYCINTAAYTAVDKSESEPDKAFLVNSLGPENLAKTCAKQGVVLIHISTDFVFDGTKKSPYQEDDSTHPLGVYGTTKWQGEQAVKQFCNNFYILRTAWVYSQFGANFMKTMLRLAAERSELSIVSDQIGTPTNAVDLAKAIVSCMLYDATTETPSYGIYHYSNEGQCSWYDFAVAIFKLKGVTIPVHSIPTAQFPTPANRPAYSVLDKSKIKKVMQLTIPEWQDSLRELLT